MEARVGLDVRDGVGHGLDDGVETLSIAGAAARLRIAPDAVRKRIRRGSLRAVKVNGYWRVILDENDVAAGTAGSRVQDVSRDAAWTGAVANGQAAARAVQDGVQPAAGTSAPGAPPTQDGQAIEAYRELVTSLREEVAFLRRELETRSRELDGRAEEVRRRDMLLDAMAQRLRQLPPPPEQPAETIGEAERLKDELEEAQLRIAEFEAVTEEREQANGASRRRWWRFWSNSE